MPLRGWSYKHGLTMTIRAECSSQEGTGLSMYRIFVNEMVLSPEEALCLFEIFQVQQSFLEIAALHNKQQWLSAVKKDPSAQQTIKVDYDATLTKRSSFSDDVDHDVSAEDTGKTAYVPAHLVAEYGMDRAFEMTTHETPTHITHYCEHAMMPERARKGQ